MLILGWVHCWYLVGPFVCGLYFTDRQWRTQPTIALSAQPVVLAQARLGCTIGPGLVW